MSSFTDFDSRLVVKANPRPICVNCKYNLDNPTYSFCEKYKVDDLKMKPSSVLFAKEGKGKCPYFAKK